MKLYASHYLSPLGEVLLLATTAGLSGCYFTGQRYFPDTNLAWQWDDASFAATKRLLTAYFQKSDSPFTLPLDLHGTPFQKRVWQALNQIPAGETYSYTEIARQIGAASAVRAVATAIGRNPVSVIVPCHRVVGSNGKLTGYAGGLDRKAWLLAHEARIVN